MDPRLTSPFTFVPSPQGQMPPQPVLGPPGLQQGFALKQICSNKLCSSSNLYSNSSYLCSSSSNLCSSSSNQLNPVQVDKTDMVLQCAQDLTCQIQYNWLHQQIHHKYLDGSLNRVGIMAIEDML